MRKTKLTEKDMTVLDETRSARVEVEHPFTSLKDYSLKHRVTMQWDLNEDAIRDRMFKLQIDDYTVILDAEELLKSIRWV